jgi:hypothetical protein
MAKVFFGTAFKNKKILIPHSLLCSRTCTASGVRTSQPPAPRMSAMITVQQVILFYFACPQRLADFNN